MRYIFTYFLIIIFISLSSCEKELTSTDNPVEIIKFDDLGIDGPYIFGDIYYGRERYISYSPGNIPVILSIPHGGDISPTEIPNRSYGISVTDSNTIELGKAISNFFFSSFNVRPYVIINNLKRTKLDANRDKAEAAQGNIYAERAFDEFHYYINSAREDIINRYGTGFLFDIHGHGVNPDGFYDMRTWIGYLLSGEELDSSDAFLNENFPINDTSIFSLIDISNETLSDILRGPNSLGSLFENNSYTALPSENSPGPDGMRYFSGGYNTYTYGADRNFNFNAIQLEFPFPGLRDTNKSRSDFASAFTEIVQNYIFIHTGIDIFEIN